MALADKALKDERHRDNEAESATVMEDRAAA
jgi:hypothetical protein